MHYVGFVSEVQAFELPIEKWKSNELARIAGAGLFASAAGVFESEHSALRDFFPEFGRVNDGNSHSRLRRRLSGIEQLSRGTGQ